MRHPLAFCLCALVGLIPAAGVVTAQDNPESKGVQEMKELRKKAAHRPRRIIFNNDGDDVVYQCKAPTPETLLACRTTPLIGSQVDSIFYCTWSSGFGLFTHNSTVAEVFTAKTGVFKPNLTKEFIEQGTDALKIMVDFCKKNNIEIVWSMRMNDTHDVSPQYPEMFPQFKKDHPEFLVGAKDKPVKHGRWTSVNYACPEVRDRAFLVIKDVCERYDIDGIEMDFLRHLTYFKSVALAQPVTQEELDMMTDLIRRVRKMTEEVGARRGRPLLVAVRVPDSAGYSRAAGLDVEQWLKEGLIDLMTVSCYFRLNPWEESVRLGHRYDVPAYPCLSECRIKGEAGKLRNSIESYRARALNAWNAGADGIYLFNYFNPNSPLWRELGDPKTLEKLDKLYFVNVRGSKGGASGGYWVEGGDRFVNRPHLSPESPLPLKPGEKSATTLIVGDDVSWGKAEGIIPQLTLRIQAAKIENPADLSVTLNGKTLGPGTLSKEWLEFSLTPEAIVKGENHFEFLLKPESKPGAALTDLMLRIQYKKGT